MSGILNGIPVIGHVKGGFHYALNDRKAGTASIKAANHTTAAITGGALGFLAGGPGGAIAGGIIGGTAADTLTTTIQYKATGKYRPEGILQPLSDPKNPGKWVEGITGVLLDGVSGKVGGKVVRGVPKVKATANSVVKAVIKEQHFEQLPAKAIKKSVIGEVKKGKKKRREIIQNNKVEVENIEECNDEDNEEVEDENQKEEDNKDLIVDIKRLEKKKETEVKKRKIGRKRALNEKIQESEVLLRSYRRKDDVDYHGITDVVNYTETESDESYGNDNFSEDECESFVLEERTITHNENGNYHIFSIDNVFYNIFLSVLILNFFLYFNSIS